MTLINKAKPSSEFWVRVNKMLGNCTKNSIEPLEIKSPNKCNPHKYDYDDATISKRLEDTHIKQLHRKEEQFDNEFKMHVDQNVETTTSKYYNQLGDTLCEDDTPITESELLN